MGGIFSFDGPLGRVMNKIGDLFVLSVLWIVFSLPLVTIGASTAALYTMTLRMVRGEEGRIAAGFWKAFKENFLQSTVIWLILAALGLGIWWYYMAFSAVAEDGYKMVYTAFWIFYLLTWLLELIFVFPVQARFANPVGRTMKNALFMAIGNLHVWVGCLVITGLPIWTLLLNTSLFIVLLPVWVLLGPGLLAWLNSFLFHHCFKKYIPSEEEEL